MRICFRLSGGVALAALASWASGPPVQPASDLTSVVRTDPRTGKLVRSVVVHNAAALAAAADHAAAEQALPPELVRSVIKTESNYNPNAVSVKGARGLMQLIPETARRFGVADASNPLENLQGGTKYLKYLLDLYHGDTSLALAAYNAGEQSVARYGGVPPFPETQKYVIQVKSRVAAATPKSPQPKPALADPAGGNHVIEIVQPDGTVRYISRRESL
ncbi:MAG TPA: lytic transglycosylase domain-containing protein [Bryobacteraceae bacterium]